MAMLRIMDLIKLNILPSKGANGHIASGSSFRHSYAETTLVSVPKSIEVI